MGSDSQLVIQILKVVSEARNTYGLRLQDPARYNAYCAKRILSLKKGLKFVQRGKKSPPKQVTAELASQDSRCDPPQGDRLIAGTLKLCYFQLSVLGARAPA